jgi:hypothetical protein
VTAEEIERVDVMYGPFLCGLSRGNSVGAGRGLM